jgi:hypothetical protein
VVHYEPRRSGKSVIVRQMIDEALARGETLNVCSLVNGEMHVCRVIPIKGRKR